jgi:hypothetical protein
MGKPKTQPAPADGVNPLTAGSTYGVSFHNVCGTAAQLLGQTAGGVNIANLGNTIINRWFVVIPWSGNSGNVFIAMTSSITVPVAGTPSGVAGILLPKGGWNQIRATDKLDVNAYFWIIGSAAAQDYDVLGV